jgi:FixJ family two-component response regulator
MKNIVLEVLNHKEREVMRLSLNGEKSIQISKLMDVSVHTVMAYKKNILKRGQSFCGKVFKDADEVAQYFRSVGWI